MLLDCLLLMCLDDDGHFMIYMPYYALMIYLLLLNLIALLWS